MLLCVRCLAMETEAQCALPLPKESQTASLRAQGNCLAHSRYMEELPGNQTVLVFFNLFAVERAKVISLEGNVAGLRKKNPPIHVPLDTNLL